MGFNFVFVPYLAVSGLIKGFALRESHLSRL